MVANVDFSGPRRLLLRVVSAKIREFPFPASLGAAFAGLAFVNFADRIAGFGTRLPPVARHANAEELKFLFEVIGVVLVAIGGGYLLFRAGRFLKSAFVRTTCRSQVRRILAILKHAVDDPNGEGLVSAAFVYRGCVI